MAQLGNTNIYGNLTVTGSTTSSGGFVGNVSGNCTGSSGSCTGNAATATTLKTSRTINGTSFNGSADITTANWGTTRSIYIADNDGTNTGNAVSVNGSSNAILKLPATIKASIIGNATLASQSNQIKTTAATNSRAYYLSFTDAAATYNNLYTNSNATYNPGEQTLKAPRVEGAVCNDLADSIPVDEDCNLEHGYCYCFDGEKYYKSSKYLDNGIIGIHSDTFGFRMGTEEDKKKMDVAVSGFVLAYVDKEYPVGTPLTCTKDGYLTEIELEDKMKYPEKIVATYWKNEPAKEWGLDNKKVKVNGRKWVKIK